jgi:hypothetical protein
VPLHPDVGQLPRATAVAHRPKTSDEEEGVIYMSTGNQAEYEQVRAAVQTITAKAGDEAFRKALHDNPVQTLLDAGMPANGIADFLTEEGLTSDEVQGYLTSFNPGSGMNIPLPNRPGIGGPAGIARPGAGGLMSCTGVSCICTSSCCLTEMRQAGQTGRMNPVRP